MSIMDREEYHFTVGVTLAMYAMFIVMFMILLDISGVTAVVGLLILSLLHVVTSLVVDSE